MEPEPAGVDRPRPGVKLVRPTGDIDAYTAPQLRSQLHQASGGDATLLVVDLSS